MSKQWKHPEPAAYRRDPFTEIEVFAPKNAETHNACYVTAAPSGDIYRHFRDGTAHFIAGHTDDPAFDLVPLQRKPREWWIVEAVPGMWSSKPQVFDAAEDAKRYASSFMGEIEVIHVIEANQ
jgi:hypothetical protein